MATTTGKAQRQASATGRSRAPNLARYYGRKLTAVDPGAFEFELTLLRGEDVSSIPLDPYVVSFEWNDEETALSGNVQLRRPGEKRSSLPIGRGHRIRCRVRWVGRWYELWTMRCDAPEVTVDPDGISLSVDLNDDLDMVRRGRRRYLRRKRKRHPHGYFGHEVIREYARKEGVKLGAIARCTKRMSSIDVTGSFLDLVVKVYEHERDATGRKFVVRMRDGKLEVVPYKRNRTIYVLSDQLRQATVTQDPKVEKPITVLVGKGHIGKGSEAKKIRHAEYRRDMVRRFGFMRKEKDYGRVDSIGDLRARVRRDLAKQYRVDTTVTVQHEGIPFIRRGDGAQVVLSSEGFAGSQSYVYCTGGRHQVQSASYTSEWSFTRVDPFLKDREEREKEAREKARRKRKQRQRSSH